VERPFQNSECQKVLLVLELKEEEEEELEEE
jgi:hypothetical protein